MTQTQTAHKEQYLTAFEVAEREDRARSSEWLRELRRDAMAAFDRMGFPTARRGNEEWKYTDVRPIARASFALPDTEAVAPPPRSALPPSDLEDVVRVGLVDGRYSPEASHTMSLPGDVFVGSLAEALATREELVRKHLGRHADFHSKPLTALNTAFLQDGALVYVPDGVCLPVPVHLRFLADGRQPRAVHPRVLVVLGAGAQATLVEEYADLASGPGFTNAVTEVVVGPGAVLDSYRLQRRGAEAYHVGSTRVALGRDSSFSSLSLDVGAALARNALDVLLDGEGASCALHGLYLAAGSQHVDNQVRIDHARPHTNSRQLYKGVMDGRSRAVFHGSITVREGAQKVDARQEDRNLLLSPHAEVDTTPAFWIYADDVKCSHGAACGQLAEDALFYLRSRGIGEPAARRLLTQGFVDEVVALGRSPQVRVLFQETVNRTLQGFPSLG